MRPLASHAPPDLTPQCRSIPQKRLSVWASRQLCYTGHTTATKYRQEHVAADAVIRDTALEAHVRSAKQPGCDDSNSGTFVASRVGAFDVSAHHSTTASAQCSACALDSEQRALQAEWLPDISTAAHSRLPSLVVLKHRLPAGGQDSGNTDAGCQSSQVQHKDAQLLYAGSAPTQHQQRQEQQQGQMQELQQQQQQHQQQQQQQQQQLLNDAAAAVEYQKNISRSLRAENCGSIEQLVAVVSQHGPQMDAHSVTASFSAAARLAKQQQQQLWSTPAAADSSYCQMSQQLRDVLESYLLPLLQTRLRQMDPVGLQVVLHALACLQFQEEVVISQLDTAITTVVQYLPPGRLCQLVWSLGKLDFRPNRQLSRSVLHCSKQCMPILTGQDLSQLLHGLVQLQLFPAQAWLDACCARVLQLCAHQQLEPRALCSTLHSLARLATAQQQQQQQQQPSAAAVPPLQPPSSQQELQQQAAQSSEDGLPAPLLLQLLHETQRALQATAAPSALQPNCSVAQHVELSSQTNGSMQHTQTQRALASAAHAGQQQLDHRQQEAWMRGQQQQQGLSLAGLVMLTDALRQLKTDPPQDWQAAYVAAAQQLMRSSDARNLPLMLAPCVRWRHAPGPAWLQQYLAACEGLLAKMQAQGLAVLGHSLAALQVQPPAAWLSAYLAAAASQRLAATPAGCSVLMHTLGAWQQLGLLQQQQHMPAAGSGPGGSKGAGKAVADITFAGGATAAATAVLGAQAAAAAAAGQQLQVQAQQLAEECLRCFKGQGHSFTAEQFGMFCKGLAQWGMRGGPQLGVQLEQVALQLLGHSHQRHRGARKQRLTAATLCNVLLALAVACPEAATPVLLSRLWAVWSAWLLPTTTAAHAAGVAWAAGRLGVQLPGAFAQALLQRLTVAPEGAQAQHVAAVLLEAKVGVWQVQQQHVVSLIGTMLQQQASELAGMLQAAAAGPQQQQQLAEPISVHSMGCGHLGVCHCGACAGGSTYSSGQPGASSLQVRHVSGSSSSADSGSTCSGPAAARLYGLANHRLKGYVKAAACVAAWYDVLPQQHLQLAARLYTRASQSLPAEERCIVQAHVRRLQSALREASSPPPTAAPAATAATAAAPLPLATATANSSEALSGTARSFHV